MAKKKNEPNGKPVTATSEDLNTSRLNYNYTVISKLDKYVAQIICSSPICNVYKFNIESGEWDKLNCQGSVFVYSRAAKEDVGDTLKFPYAVIVINRLNMDDFSVGITPLSIARRTEDLEMEVKYEDPFIMIHGSDGAMYGLWLFNESDRELFRTTIDWCLNQVM